MLCFTTLPTFVTARLTIRPRTMDDLDECLAMDRDPEVTRFIPGPWTNPVTHRAFIEERMRHKYPPGMGYWSIIAAEGFLGWILLIPADLRGPEVEIGWRLIRAAWGRGYATEAAQPVLRHALHQLRLSQVIADIDPANAASARVARKLGLEVQGLVTGGGGHELIRYAAAPSWSVLVPRNREAPQRRFRRRAR